MTSKTLSKEQIKALEFQTNQLYESFRRTVDTQVHQDAIWNRELFTAFGKSLSDATNYSAFMDWNRDSQRASVFDKYLLHYALGSTPSFTLEQVTRARQHGHEFPTKETEVIADTLKQAIDNPKVPYSRIQLMAMSLGDAHDFAGVVSALGYVREKYQRSKKE